MLPFELYPSAMISSAEMLKISVYGALRVTQNACLTTAVNSWVLIHAFLTSSGPALRRQASRVLSPFSVTLLRLFLVSRPHALRGVLLYLGDQCVTKTQDTSHSPCTTSLLGHSSNYHVHEHQGRLSVSGIVPSSCNADAQPDGMSLDFDRRMPLSNGRAERSLSRSTRTYRLSSCDLHRWARGRSEMVSHSTESSLRERSSTRSLTTESKSEFSFIIRIPGIDPTPAPLRVRRVPFSTTLLSRLLRSLYGTFVFPQLTSTVQST